MKLVPMNLEEANLFVGAFHRHNKPVIGHRFSIGLNHDNELIGVAIVGRPVSRVLDCAQVAEITRLCVRDNSPKGACSKLYRACWRAWLAMGGMKLITYTLQTESGASLRGAGFKIVGEVKGRSWDCPSRHREWQPVNGQQKFRWELTA